ncbi:MAG: hypothetical protein HGA71_02810 [Azonexaceae bacterium]|nr:hypothetical protein [Azonexaceae bacterium]
MKKNFLVAALSIAVATASSVAYAQLGALSSALGGAGSGSSVSAEGLVRNYVGGTKNVMTADIYMLNALGLKEQAAKEELAMKNLTEGSTSAGLEDAAKVQTESSKALEEKMNGKKVTMDAEGKKNYSLGLLSLAKGVKDYMGMSGDVKNFRPGLGSIGGAGGAAVYVVKSLPDSTTNLLGTLKKAVAFARENKIEVPAEATSVL